MPVVIFGFIKRVANCKDCRHCLTCLNGWVNSMSGARVFTKRTKCFISTFKLSSGWFHEICQLVMIETKRFEGFKHYPSAIFSLLLAFSASSTPFADVLRRHYSENSCVGNICVCCF